MRYYFVIMMYQYVSSTKTFSSRVEYRKTIQTIVNTQNEQGYWNLKLKTRCLIKIKQRWKIEYFVAEIWIFALMNIHLNYINLHVVSPWIEDLDWVILIVVRCLFVCLFVRFEVFFVSYRKDRVAKLGFGLKSFVPMSWCAANNKITILLVFDVP